MAGAGIEGISAGERTSEAGDGTIASYQEFVARKSYADYQIHYRPRGNTWFVLSGEGNGKIFYEKVVFSCGGRLINSFALMPPPIGLPDNQAHARTDL